MTDKTEKAKGQDERSVGQSELMEGLSCPACRSTSMAHFDLEFQDFTHRTMCHDCKEWSDGMSFEESDAHFKAAR